MVGCLPFGLTAAAQTSRTAGEVPYLARPVPFAPNAPGSSASAPGPSVASPKGRTANVDDLKQRDQELATVRAEQQKSLGNEAKLKREIESIGDDRRKLNAEMIEAAARIRAVEEQIAQTENRIAPIDEREAEVRKSLFIRRGALTEILAALQRLGHQPPPAIMVKAEDALQSLRSAMLLGALLPEMRQEAESLLVDLGELARVRHSLSEERFKLNADLATIAEDRARLALLLNQRQRQQAEVDASLLAERERAAELGQQAENLKELMTRLEQGVDLSGRATRAGNEKNKTLDTRSDPAALAALKDPGRLAPAVAFGSARGMLPLPVNGARIKDFGASDGVGGTEKGLSISARAGAQVTAPCDGWVVYAGPFRNYGQLLILNAGSGYHVLLAGMERISAELGQFVVTGEPVAVMGGRAQVAAILAVGSGQPVLYVEFRKDGVPVDPSPWWAASQSEKVRG